MNGINILNTVFWLGIINMQGRNAADDEYCSGETFKPQCSSTEVVVMKHALYGRMSVGRCVSVDVGSCSENVLKWMDQKCSGRRGCEMIIPDHGLNELVPCTKEYTPYLEASFSCISVIQIDCSSSAIPVTSTLSTISSVLSQESGCGLPESPWSLQAKPGQKINVTLTDFNWNEEENRRDHSSCRIKYGNIVDTGSNDIVDVCGGRSRTSGAYVSKGNVIQVVFLPHVLQQHSFLLQFQAVGCPDFVPPKHSWMHTEGDKVTIGCQSGNDQWTLRCTGTRWQGQHGRCDDDSIAVPESRASKEKSSLPNVISLSLIAGTTLVICCVAVTSLIVYFCYKKYKSEYKEAGDYYSSTIPARGNSSNPTMIPLPNGTMVSYRSFQPATMNCRMPLRSGLNARAGEGTLTGQIIDTGTDTHRGNIIDEVIYDDPANLDANSVQYVNQFNSINSGNSIINSLQYTKLQKQNT